MFFDRTYKYSSETSGTGVAEAVPMSYGSRITYSSTTASITIDEYCLCSTTSDDQNLHGDGTNGEEDALRKQALLEAAERQERIDSIKAQYENDRKVALPVNDGFMVSQSERCGRRYPTGFG